MTAEPIRLPKPSSAERVRSLMAEAPETDFLIIVTRTGETVGIMSSREIAVAHVKARMKKVPGLILHVEERTVTETRRRVYRPRPSLTVVNSEGEPHR
jgi:hypothetical protein